MDCDTPIIKLTPEKIKLFTLMRVCLHKRAKKSRKNHKVPPGTDWIIDEKSRLPYSAVDYRKDDADLPTTI